MKEDIDKKDSKPKNKVGRPKKIIDLKQVEALAMIQCTDEEIAAVLDVDIRTITRKKEQKRSSFVQAYKRGKQKGKTSLRRLQWKAAQGLTYYAYFCDKKQSYSHENICGIQRDKKNSVCGSCSGARHTTLTEFKGGATGMLIWLGKQWLGQKDKTEIAGDKENPLKLRIEDFIGLTKEELMKIAGFTSNEDK